MPCEYCGRDLPLVVDDKWCTERCKYAREVYEQGEFVVDLDTEKLVRRIGARKSARYRLTYSKAKFFSKVLCSCVGKIQNRVMSNSYVRDKIRKKLTGRKNSDEVKKHKKEARNRSEVRAAASKKSKEDWAKKTTEQLAIEMEHKRVAIYECSEVLEKIRLAAIRSGKRLIAEGKHNWPKEKPVNNPTERIFDFFFAFIFLLNWNHNFKSLAGMCREFELDFVSWLLHFGVEANEPYHDEEKDRNRDKFIVDSGDLDFTYRYTTEYAITNMIDVIKKVYEFANQQREKYNYDLSILEFDDCWVSYCLQMQGLLKEWHLREKGRERFKVFREKKREIDKQWLCLLEETSQKYSTNFAIVYREILEKDLKLSYKNVTSPWRETQSTLASSLKKDRRS